MKKIVFVLFVLLIVKNIYKTLKKYFIVNKIIQGIQYHEKLFKTKITMFNNNDGNKHKLNINY